MQYVLEKRAKLVGRMDKGSLWLLNVHDDWIHDQYGESYIYHGTIYSSREPFHPLSTSISGYFKMKIRKNGLRFGMVLQSLIQRTWLTLGRLDLKTLLKLSLKLVGIST